MVEKTLFVISSFSKAMASVCLFVNQKQHGETIFVSLNNPVAEQLKAIGLEPIKLDISVKRSWAEHDTLFREVAVPGDFDDVYLPDTNFPVWKSLSLDRLYFWFKGAHASTQFDLLDSFNFTDVVVSLDIETPAIWQLATKYKTTAIQCHSILDRGYADIAPYLPFNQIIVRDEGSYKFLEKFGVAKEKLLLSGENEVLPAIPPINKQSVLQNLSLIEPLSVIIYDAQCEWAFRRWLAAATTKLHIPKNCVAIYVTSQHDMELLLTTCPNLPYQIIDDQIILAAATEIIMFRYNEEVSRGARCPVNVYDIHDRFLSSKVSS